MADKDQFTFEDEDDSPAKGTTRQAPPKPVPAGGEILFDMEDDLTGTRLGRQSEEDAGSGSEEFFFATEDDDSEPAQVGQAGFDEPEESGFTGDEGLFGNNLNAGFPEDEESIDDPVDFAPEPQMKSAAGSKNRTLLMVLLLVIVAAGGAYYFMDLGSTTPSVPTVQMPVEKPVKAVAVPPPPPPAKAPEETVAAEKEKPVTVAVPPPPVPVVAKVEDKTLVAEAKPAPVETPRQAESTAGTPASTSVALPAVVPAPTQPAPVVTEKTAPAPPVKVAETAEVKTMAAPKPVATVTPVETAKPVAAPKQVAGGAFSLDAGSYLLESNSKALVAKIAKLGYEPLVTPVDATLDMTRLRLGTFSKDEVQAALYSAREIEPGSYSAPAGDGYVIYAGTFLKTNTLEKIKDRFLAAGLQVKSEPVQVVRTLSRVRFGSFATKEDAAAAARAVAEAGVKASVVKAK